MGGAGCGSRGRDQGCNIRNNLLIWKYFTDCSVSCPRIMGKKCGFLGWVGWKLKMSKHSRDDWYGPTVKLYAPHKTLPCPRAPSIHSEHYTGLDPYKFWHVKSPQYTLLSPLSPHSVKLFRISNSTSPDPPATSPPLPNLLLSHLLLT